MFPEVIVPGDLRERCRRYAMAMLAHHRARGSHVAWVGSAAEACPIEIEAHARVSECALALLWDLDPLTALDWVIHDQRGKDHDLTLSGHLIDVKAIRFAGDVEQTLLIWPLHKRDRLAARRFDAFALMRGDGTRFEWLGWAARSRFLTDHRTETNGGRLKPGTWYMTHADLASPYAFPGFRG